MTKCLDRHGLRPRDDAAPVQAEAQSNQQAEFSPFFYSVDYFCWVVIITTMNSKQVIKQLEADGWILRSVRGSHHVFTHPSKPEHISVPHPKQDLGVGLVHKLLKQAGLK